MISHPQVERFPDPLADYTWRHFLWSPLSTYVERFPDLAIALCYMWKDYLIPLGDICGDFSWWSSGAGHFCRFWRSEKL